MSTAFYPDENYSVSGKVVYADEFYNTGYCPSMSALGESYMTTAYNTSNQHKETERRTRTERRLRGVVPFCFWYEDVEVEY